MYYYQPILCTTQCDRTINSLEISKWKKLTSNFYNTNNTQRIEKSIIRTPGLKL